MRTIDDALKKPPDRQCRKSLKQPGDSGPTNHKGTQKRIGEGKLDGDAVKFWH
jgi:hypothetical protein